MRAYAAHFTTSIREEMRYLWSDAIWGGALMALYSTVTIAIYTATGLAAVGGLAFGTLVWYFIFVQALSSSKGNYLSSFNEHIRNGDVATYMSRPIYLPFALFAEHVASAAVMFGSAAVFGVPLAFALAGALPVTVPGVLAFLLLLTLGVIIDFAISLSIGLVAFWTEDAKPYFWVYKKCILILGGIFFPLNILPGMWRTVALHAPPAYAVYWPAHMLVAFDARAFPGVLLGAAVTAALTLGVMALVYSRALRKVNINGG